MHIVRRQRVILLLSALTFILLLSWPVTAIAHDKDEILLVNKQKSLPADYVPGNLATPEVKFSDDQEKLQAQAADALESMFAAAKNDGVQLYAASGYRSYSYQKGLYHYWVEQYGEKQANRISAKPGESEHQTGLTMDVTSEEVDFQLKQSFGDTKAGKWIEQYAAEYGFIIRYQEGKEPITGYDYEPWHLRYVGKDHAKKITANHITLETYMSYDVDKLPERYTIQGGDTLYQIALEHGVAIKNLLALNPGTDPHSLTIGDELQLSGQDIYKVQAGDTLSSIAAKYPSVSAELLMEVNKNVVPTSLLIGSFINIP